MFYIVHFQVPFTIVFSYQVNPARNLVLIIAESWGRGWGCGVRRLLLPTKTCIKERSLSYYKYISY